jgi:hypothetical protein
MKKFFPFLIAAVVLFMTGCIDNYTPSKPSTLPTPVPTTSTTSGLTVGATIMYALTDGTANAVVIVVNGSTPLSGATVTINGQPLAFTSGIGYSGAVTGLSVGATVTLSITSSSGSASASCTVPATSGASTTATVTGAAAGSSLMVMSA